MITTRKKTPIEIGARIEEIPELSPEIQTKMGVDLLAEAAAEPNMDRFLDRSPKVGKPIDYDELVSVLHRKREMFITAEAKKRSGVKDEEKTDEEG